MEGSVNLLANLSHLLTEEREQESNLGVIIVQCYIYLNLKT